VTRGVVLNGIAFKRLAFVQLDLYIAEFAHCMHLNDCHLPTSFLLWNPS